MATLLDLTLHLADNAIILGQRNAEWCGHGPLLEEDIAMANISLDLIGQARLLYQLAARIENESAANQPAAKGGEPGAAAMQERSEDHYAYWRGEGEFRNLTLCELPHSAPLSGNARAERDYAVTIVRNFLYSAWMVPLWQHLEGQGADRQPLADIAAKSVKEARYHLRHARDWLLRLGDGTPESHARTQAALDHLLPYCDEFWLRTELSSGEVRAVWEATLSEAFAEATLQRPEARPHQRATASLGRHSEHMGYLLAEMQSLARAHPGARW